MNINVIPTGDSFSKFQKIVEVIYEKYLGLLHNKPIFQAKCNILRVNLLEYDACSTSGVCIEKEIDSSFSYTINLFINENDSEKYIAFVIAHEFAHLLFSNSLDPIRATGKANDESTAFSAIRRGTPERTIYGKTLEEICADYIAIHVISYLDYIDKNDQFEIMCKEKEEKINYIEAFSTLFGDSMSKYTYIDSYYSTEDEFVIQNKFWYYVSTFSLNEIIDEYDYYMGANAFHILNNHIEEYFENNNQEAKTFIYSELSRFKTFRDIS